jgi:hypothetical protein
MILSKMRVQSFVLGVLGVCASLSYGSLAEAPPGEKVQMAITVDDLPDHTDLPDGWTYDCGV